VSNFHPFIFWGEGSTSFRFWLHWVLHSLLFPVFVFLFPTLCINDTNRIMAKPEEFCCCFEMFGADILLRLRIGPL
jgi:hypothetical protein